MKVKKISVANVEVSSLPKLLDEEKIGFQPINQVNWTEYPYCPKVEFRVAHTESAILLHFKVTEASVRARYGEEDVCKRQATGYYTPRTFQCKLFCSRHIEGMGGSHVNQIISISLF